MEILRLMIRTDEESTLVVNTIAKVLRVDVKAYNHSGYNVKGLYRNNIAILRRVRREVEIEELGQSFQYKLLVFEGGAAADRALTVGMFCFDKLKRAGRYTLALVDSQNDVLEYFHPQYHLWQDPPPEWL